MNRKLKTILSHVLVPVLLLSPALTSISAAAAWNTLCVLSNRDTGERICQLFPNAKHSLYFCHGRAEERFSTSNIRWEVKWDTDLSRLRNKMYASNCKVDGDPVDPPTDPSLKTYSCFFGLQCDNESSDGMLTNEILAIDDIDAKIKCIKENASDYRTITEEAKARGCSAVNIEVYPRLKL
ncbi:MAG: hypothetical protein HQK52_16400 [Oligoflexia bacterium]|nr:hypothetical protein [Oligoflexia bacterium]